MPFLQMYDCMCIFIYKYKYIFIFTYRCTHLCICQVPTMYFWTWSQLSMKQPDICVYLIWFKYETMTSTHFPKMVDTGHTSASLRFLLCLGIFGLAVGENGENGCDSDQLSTLQTLLQSQEDQHKWLVVYSFWLPDDLEWYGCVITVEMERERERGRKKGCTYVIEYAIFRVIALSNGFFEHVFSIIGTCFSLPWYLWGLMDVHVGWFICNMCNMHDKPPEIDLMAILPANTHTCVLYFPCWKTCVRHQIEMLKHISRTVKRYGFHNLGRPRPLFLFSQDVLKLQQFFSQALRYIASKERPYMEPHEAPRHCDSPWVSELVDSWMNVGKRMGNMP